MYKINGIEFSFREIEILACIIKGRSRKTIAIILHISPETVHSHLKHIRSKIGCISKDQIIDFIESSSEYNLLHKRYFRLMGLDRLIRTS